MTEIAIVGGGRAATLHAEAAMAASGVDLIGVGGRPGTATALAAATGVPDLSLDELAERADGLVIAVPSDQAAAVIAQLPPRLPILVESPVLIDHEQFTASSAMTAVNLLHSPTVKRGLRAITDLGPVHHLVLRGRAVRRPHMTDVAAEPFAGAWPVLLAAAGTVAETVTATRSHDHIRVTVRLADGRRITAELEWVDPAASASALTELEAAGDTGVVTIGLWPVPTLDIDGRPLDQGPAHGEAEHPLVSLGFIEQIRRFAGVCRDGAEPWPPLSVGQGITNLTRAANHSALTGEPVSLARGR